MEPCSAPTPQHPNAAPSPTSEDESNPLPEFASLQISPQSRFGSPLQSPKASRMRDSTNCSTEAGGVLGNTLVAVMEQTMVDKQGNNVDSEVNGHTHAYYERVDPMIKEATKLQTENDAKSIDANGTDIVRSIPDGHDSLDASESLQQEDSAEDDTAQENSKPTSDTRENTAVADRDVKSEGGCRVEIEDSPISKAHEGPSPKVMNYSNPGATQPFAREESIQEFEKPRLSQETVADNTNGTSVPRIENSQPCAVRLMTQSVHAQSPNSRIPGLQAVRSMSFTPGAGKVTDTDEAFRAPYMSYRPRSALNNVQDISQLQVVVNKLRQDLEHERKSAQSMLKAVEAEAQERIGAALSAMLDDLLQKQIEVVKENHLLHAKSLELERRTRQTEQLEFFLAVGQRQLYYEADEKNRPRFSQAELDNAYRKAEIDAWARIKAYQNELSTRVRELDLWKANLQDHELQYKTLIRESLEKELRVTLEAEIETRISEAAHDRGFAAGRNVGHAERVEEALKEGYLDGYNASQRNQNKVYQLFSGKIPYDSPDLDFLVNPDHPENPFNRGMQIGRRELEKRSVRLLPPHQTLWDELNAAPIAHKGYSVLGGGDNSQKPQDEAQRSDAIGEVRVNTTQPLANNCGLNSNGYAAPNIHNSARADEKPIRPNPETRYTSRNTNDLNESGSNIDINANHAHDVLSASRYDINGYHDRDAERLAAPASPMPNGNILKAARMAKHSGEKVYSGRRILRYEESDNEGTVTPETSSRGKANVVRPDIKAPNENEDINLIDLY